ncbi:GNAT family N-acetyltransferase [Halobacillus sp. Marseille-P3879]|uniref:GNAT family N-acetyltransferase n=1 Tax=Halobacillus sp. Marseille-P3879 TaxID=2045014 RepID=UPI000C79F8A3|nr:GNAT family protein [Halobacillus sp. Marseille-P3879]
MNNKPISFRAFETKDIRELHRWFNDPVSLQTVGRTPLTYEETVTHVEQKRQNGDLLLSIEDKDCELVGWIFLQNIEYGHGRASLGILLAPESRGQGVGKYAIEEILNIGFNQLRLNKIYLTTRGKNEQAYGLYKKIGFVKEGELRNHTYIDGKYYDTYFMGLLASEWNK